MAQISTTRGASNFVVPLNNALKRTKELDLSSALSSSAGTIDLKELRVVFEADSLGNWWISGAGKVNYNAQVDLSGAGTKYLTIANVNMRNASGHLNAMNNAFASQLAHFETGGNQLQYITASTTIQYVRFSFCIPLAAEPTTYTTAANMEGLADVAVYVEPASATASGIVTTGTQTIAGVKTFSDGVKLDDAAGQSTLNYFVETTGSFTITSSAAGSGGTGTATVSTRLSRIGNRVTVSFQAFNITLGGTVGFLVSETAIPSAFRPSTNAIFTIFCKEDGSNLAAPSALVIYSTGRIDIYKTGVPGATFANGVAGLNLDTSVSYNI